MPDDYIVTDDLYKFDVTEHDVRAKDTAWAVSRLDLANLKAGVKETCEDQTMPSWGAFNSLITDENLPQKSIRFLPVIPYPVTEYSTVYTSLKHFQDVLGQLNQSHMAVTCDEGVYHIAREIMLQRPEEFSNIVLCIGSFHMLKVVLGSIGKYIEGSAAETIFVENKVFGANVVKSVLAGTHYERSMKGMMMLSECIERLQWSEFFRCNGTSRYQVELCLLKDLKQSVSKKDRDTSKEILDQFVISSANMIEDFKTFKLAFGTSLLIW